MLNPVSDRLKEIFSTHTQVEKYIRILFFVLNYFEINTIFFFLYLHI